jgi:hypothetical protein
MSVFLGRQKVEDQGILKKEVTKKEIYCSFGVVKRDV